MLRGSRTAGHVCAGSAEGDALTSPSRSSIAICWLIADCVFDGHRLAREIDSENPEVPKPFIRERAVIERELAAV